MRSKFFSIHKNTSPLDQTFISAKLCRWNTFWQQDDSTFWCMALRFISLHTGNEFWNFNFVTSLSIKALTELSSHIHIRFKECSQTFNNFQFALVIVYFTWGIWTWPGVWHKFPSGPTIDHPLKVHNFETITTGNIGHPDNSCQPLLFTISVGYCNVTRAYLAAS